jgi:integrase
MEHKRLHPKAELARPVRPADLAVAHREMAERLAETLRAGQNPATQRAYAGDWAHFEAWCEQQGFAALPATPATVALYLNELTEPGTAGARPRAAATIRRRIASISHRHQLAYAQGHERASEEDRHRADPTKDPRVKLVWKAIRKKIGTEQRQVEAVLGEQLARMIRALPMDLKGLRDRALLLIGFGAALRRSELVALRVEDVVAHERQLIVSVRSRRIEATGDVKRGTKADQEGRGARVPVDLHENPELCPRFALWRWRDTTGIESGPLFFSVVRGKVTTRLLHGNDVARIVKAAAKAAGIDPADFSGHSLRRGLITSLSRGGKTHRDIMRRSRHKSVAMVDRYIQDEELTRDAGERVD